MEYAQERVGMLRKRLQAVSNAYYGRLYRTPAESSLQELPKLRNQRSFAYVAEAAVGTALNLLRHEIAFNEYMKANKEFMDEVNERGKALLKRDAPQCIRGTVSFDYKANDGDCCLSELLPSVRDVTVDEIKEIPEHLRDGDMTLIASTEPQPDEATRYCQEFLMPGTYSPADLEITIRRLLEVFEENDGHGRGILGSMYEDIPQSFELFGKVWNWSNANFYAKKRSDSVGSDDGAAGMSHDYAAVDVIFPVDHRSMKGEYPSTLQSLTSIDCMIEVLDLAEKRTALELELNRKHLRMRMNVKDRCLIWSEFDESRECLMACRDLNGSRSRRSNFELIDFATDNFRGECRIVITPNVQLPLGVHLNLPRFHFEFKATQAEEKGSEQVKILEARIVDMELRFIGKTVRTFFPGLTRVLEYLIQSFRLKRTVVPWMPMTSSSSSSTDDPPVKANDDFFLHDQVSVVVPKLSKTMKKTIDRMMADDPKKSGGRSNARDSSGTDVGDDDKENQEGPKDKFYDDYCEAALSDLKKMYAEVRQQ